MYLVQNKNIKVKSVSNHPLKTDVVYSVNENVKPVSNLITAKYFTFFRAIHCVRTYAFSHFICRLHKVRVMVMVRCQVQNELNSRWCHLMKEQKKFTVHGSCGIVNAAWHQVAAGLWTKPSDLSHRPAYRQPLNCIHHCHLFLLLSLKVVNSCTRFTVPRRVEGWVDLGGC